MDPEKTAPFTLEGRGDAACLLLHGFTGSPWDVRPLGEALAARGLHVHAPRLPGHGTRPSAMAHVGRADWEAAAADALLGLSGFRHVFVGGLSMGALLAVLLAARRPERVAGLALMAPALRFKGPKFWALRRLRHTPVLELALPWVTKQSTDIEDAGALGEAPILRAFPSARLNDLFHLQDVADLALPQVRCPALVVVSRQDHVVDPDGGKVLARALKASPRVRLVSLQEGFHILPRDRAGAVLAEEVGGFFGRLLADRGAERVEAQADDDDDAPELAQKAG